MRTLVTGGAGFIGSHLVDALVERGDDVVVLDNLATGRAENVTRDAKFVEGDVSQPDDVMEAIAGCDVVFHQAALGSVPRSVARPLDTDRANVHGTLTVLAAAREAGVQRVVLASSSSVYGGASQVPTPEDLQLMPRSPYAVSKLTGEHYSRVAWELHSLQTVCLRYFNVFGPRQRPDSEYAAVIPRFIDSLLNGLPPEVHGDGLQARDFTFVSDAVQANLCAAEAPPEACAGKAYNVAHGSPHSLLDLLAVLKAELGVDLEPVHVGSRPGDVRLSHADVSAAQRDLGYVPVVSFEEGLVKTLDWFRSRQRELLGS
ncbi:MAG TPA: SDR family oxidoreductase [Acidimicrobiales bacterium]|nr:SDR family oxidoreductase [Acidimicrobiales bacterium]